MHQEKPEVLAHRRERWLRPDAARCLRPDWRGRKQGLQPPAVEAADDGGPSLAELQRAQASLAHLRWLVADLKFDLTLRALRRKYSPDQPRVPAGSREGGQWTDAGGGTQQDGRAERSNGDDIPTGQGKVRLAGEIPTNDTPEIPKQRPLTLQERNRFARRAAKWGGRLGLLIEAASWLSAKDVGRIAEGSIDARKRIRYSSYC